MNQPNHILQRLLDAAQAYAETSLITMNLPLSPSWVIVTGDNRIELRFTPWGSEAEKLTTEFLMRIELQALKAKAYSFLSEAWVAVVDKDKIEGEHLKPGELPARLRPDRIEMVLAMATDGETMLCRRWRMERNSAGRVTKLLLDKDGEWEAVSGWVMRLLD